MSTISCSVTNQSISKQPNFIILLADDLGYSDLNCYGGKVITPNIDKLAGNGIKFTDFYALAPNCSPSRVGLLTGRFPTRTGMYSYRPEWGKHPMHLKMEEITIPEILKQHGYQTAHFGKWHLGCLPQDSLLQQPQPDQQGFDFSFGTQNNSKPSHLNPVNFVRNGEEVGKLNGYSCQLVADEVEFWLKNRYNKKNPFFLYVAFNEVHKKIASPPEMTDHYVNYKEQDAEYYANIENLDNAVGRIMQTINELELDDNTFVLFSSDNGPYRHGSSGEFRGLKGEVYEGGIRVPGVLYWPQKVSSQETIETPVSLIDIFPTIFEICRIPLPSDRTIDGCSILPLIEGKRFERSTPLIWFFYRSSPEVAMRIDKYIIVGKANDTIPRTHYISEPDLDFIKNIRIKEYKLYNIKTDIYQSKDISKRKPEIFNSMKSELQQMLGNIIEDGVYWDNLPQCNPEKAQLKEKYRR